MLIDEVEIKVRAGHGGCGAVAFNKAKFGVGPTGGSGGKGASIFFEGTSNLGALSQFRYKKEIIGDDGKNGRNKFRDGADSNDIVVKIPVGSIVNNLSSGESFEITLIGQKTLIAKGGKGGKGNFLFRSSTRTSPEKFQKGLDGQEFRLRIELKLIADVGFIGLPNAGKSSLLNELTNAKSRVASYHFTTLEPHLGVYFELILADIPGIINGSSVGRGLGIKFLRHIDRTRALFHLVSADSNDPVKDYKTIRKELGSHKKELLDKDEYIFLSKCDLLNEDEVKEKISEFKKINKKVIPISIIDDESIKQVEVILREIIKKKLS